MSTESIRESTLLADGRAALARGDWQQAVTALDAAVAADPADAAAWESLGVACTWLHDVDRTIAARQRAYTLYRECGDDRSAARVALDLVYDFIEVRGEEAVANGWYQRARRLLEGLPVAAEHAVLRIWDAYMAIDTDPAGARAHAHDAAAISKQVGAADVEVLALALEGLACVSDGSVAEGMSLLDESVAGAIGGEFSDPQWFYFACCCMIDACDRVRDFGRSLEWCHRLREFAERWRVQAFLTTCRIKFSGALLWRGDWQVCEAELERALKQSTATMSTAVAAAAVRLAELRRRQGRVSEARALLERADTHPLASIVGAALALDNGDTATAADVIDRLLRRTPRAARTERVAALELRVRLAASLGQVDQAEDAAAELDSIAGMIDTDALRAVALVASGLVTGIRSEHERARLCFDDAAYLFQASGSPYEAARARIELASVLIELRREPAAEAEASAALAALERLGAETEAARARALLARIERDAASPARTTRQSGARSTLLTRRQCEVLALVAQGLSDRDIAERLFLSEHTVHRHVANILDRLGVSSRTAAVARALRGELL